MKVILLQDIENLGKKLDVKEVKDGYARNFLIPKNLVKLATKQSLIWLETQKEIMAKVAEGELEETQKKVSAIDGQEITIMTKVGKKEELFESISSQKIAEELKKIGIEIEKKQVDLETPIKKLGAYQVKIKFEHNLEAEIKVIISAEEEKEAEI
ncbi:MAG: 50S ribosomal protein L9 [Candidatus Nealsonbacteria bacterium CG_4_8_14_3_um_filter_39_7]|uniref:Large ribosomal subunit protein bL9 n=1 Tax=Candidatus Nealsonbacteria bacterium CG23_combo_of_CG06-09_8_20_14_all_39_17 TaxID=1974722 RepID=A0A2G9YUM0_9BACT|nr:MAG: 50S ribosomal protein L9 [Candidatus Nealsonbacteria bacterium CG23_combo_of_CG06-09_8_20_14_all_39_17]PIU44087.1 MAG: 50S ribosomal protein L9 [Candidatus Nealsonbacteria bacterium CG07_land_8_20_14_0_80_39_13]PIW91737.1 MAG: 50S ribosomal protein L9 [Candidatus Nealsonbacteria bacterium CG_4_8_14_3_um_filter_39_7]